MKKLPFLFFLLLVLTNCASHPKKLVSNNKPYVVMLSLDGFRWDYPQIYHTPVLDSIAKHGIRAQGLIPCFPSKTFPNHYSIATGLYPDHHGIINNSFHHPTLNREYKISDRTAVEDPRFYKGEPIWVTAKKQGLKTASYFWVGSETKIGGIQPDIWKKFDSRITFADRIDSVITWLQLPENKRPHLITFYYEQPDMVGHRAGPKSIQTKQVVEQIDSLLGVFCRKKNQLPMADSINLIIVSDHGMAQTKKEKAIDLNRIISQEMLLSCYGNNPFFLIEPKNEFKDSIYSVLSGIKGIEVWRKEEIPDSLHYGRNEIIPSLVVCSKPGWSVYQNRFSEGGTHGYSPYFSDMHAIFYACGPAFKQNYTQEAFQNIEIYNLICNLLRLVPAPNDGHFSNISTMLKNQTSDD